MAITAAQVLARAQDLLFDQEGVRWPESELLNWIADAQILVAKHVPESTSTIASIPLVVGTLQSFPSDYSRLLKLIRNQGPGGDVPGSAITITTKESLDAVRPNWHDDVGDTEVLHYVYEPQTSRRQFYVYPGPAEPIRVQAALARECPTTLASGDTLYVSDFYINALVDWTMFRALSKQADYGSAGPRAQTHAQAFASAIGMEMSTRGLVDPNREIRGQGNG